MVRRLSIAALLALLAVGGCRRGIEPPRPAEAQRMGLAKGTILLLPPRDVVQDGKPHTVGANSGAHFQMRLAEELAARGWQSTVTDDAVFSNSEIPKKSAAVDAARKSGSKYVLRVVLGEFLDAFPMTFRPDFVGLRDARMWRSDGTLAWLPQRPLASAGTNILGYERLLDELASFVAEDLTTAAALPPGLEVGDDPMFVSDLSSGQQRPLGSAPAPAPAPAPAKSSAVPAPPPKSAEGECTTEQILAMKNSGVSDTLIKRACDK